MIAKAAMGKALTVYDVSDSYDELDGGLTEWTKFTKSVAALVTAAAHLDGYHAYLWTWNAIS